MESKTCSTTTKEREEKKRRKSGRDRKKCVLRSESWRPMMAVKEAVVASPILLQCCSSGTNESAHTYTTTKRKSWVQSYRFFRIASAPVGVFTLRVCVCVLALPLSLSETIWRQKSGMCAQRWQASYVEEYDLSLCAHERVRVTSFSRYPKRKWWMMNEYEKRRKWICGQVENKQKLSVAINTGWQYYNILFETYWALFVMKCLRKSIAN